MVLGAYEKRVLGPRRDAEERLGRQRSGLGRQRSGLGRQRSKWPKGVTGISAAWRPRPAVSGSTSRTPATRMQTNLQY